MFFKLFFNRWPLPKKMQFLINKGVLIGSRKKENRTIFIYMYNDFFVEVLFKNDRPGNDIESGSVVKGLENLNNYLENEFRTTF